MSTYSSYLLAFSSILLQDVVGPNMKKQLNGRERVRFTQLGILLIGIFIYLWGAFYHLPESVFRYITLTGALSFATSLTVLVGGIYWKRANVRGAYWAFLGSAVPPIACLAMPAIDPTYAGLLSFVLAPFGLVAGSLVSTKGSGAARLRVPDLGAVKRRQVVGAHCDIRVAGSRRRTAYKGICREKDPAWNLRRGFVGTGPYALNPGR